MVRKKFQFKNRPSFGLLDFAEAGKDVKHQSKNKHQADDKKKKPDDERVFDGVVGNFGH
jgi:hypothetical protein